MKVASETPAVPDLPPLTVVSAAELEATQAQSAAGIASGLSGHRFEQSRGSHVAAAAGPEDRRAHGQSTRPTSVDRFPAPQHWGAVLLAMLIGTTVTGICLSIAAWSSVATVETAQPVESSSSATIVFPEVVPPQMPSRPYMGPTPTVAPAVVAPSLPGPVPLPVSPLAGALTSAESPSGTGTPGLAGLSLTGGANLLLAIPDAAAPTVFEEDAVDQPPRAIGERARTYPAEALALQVEGHVRLRLRIDREGRVQDVRVLDSDPPGVFDASAVEDARRWLFAPARHEGEAVEVWATSRIDYALE